MLKKILGVALLLTTALSVNGCTSMFEHSSGMVGDRLSDCPAWPRCRSSFATSERHAIAPLKIVGAPERAWAEAQKAVEAMDRTTVVTVEGDYLHAEVRSPWNFYTDDLELLLQASMNEIAVRSSGRIGYFDFNVNRDRIEALRAQLADKGVVAP